MAKVTQKVALSPSRDIPFNKHVLNRSTVRRITTGVSVEELAESMQRVGLHPLDQLRSFQALHEKVQGEEAIAAAFFVTQLSSA